MSSAVIEINPSHPPSPFPSDQLSIVLEDEVCFFVVCKDSVLYNAGRSSICFCES